MREHGIDLDDIIEIAEHAGEETVFAIIPERTALHFIEKYNKTISPLDVMDENLGQIQRHFSHNVRMHMDKDMYFDGLTRKEAFFTPEEN